MKERKNIPDKKGDFLWLKFQISNYKIDCDGSLIHAMNSPGNSSIKRISSLWSSLVSVNKDVIVSSDSNSNDEFLLRSHSDVEKNQIQRAKVNASKMQPCCSRGRKLGVEGFGGGRNENLIDQTGSVVTDTKHFVANLMRVTLPLLLLLSGTPHFWASFSSPPHSFQYLEKLRSAFVIR